jgi:hypothetical protein
MEMEPSAKKEETKIEVTPTMIVAADEILRTSQYEFWSSLDEIKMGELLAQIYRAMHKAAPH